MEQEVTNEVERLQRRVAELEARLKSSAADDLQNLLQSSPLPIITFDLDGHITTWNEAAERLFGWTADEVLGMPLPFIPPEKRQEHTAMRQRDLSGQYFTQLEITRKRKDGTPIELSVSTAPLRSGSGEIQGILSLYADITEQKRSQRALETSEQRQRLALEAGHIALFDWDFITDQVIWSERVYELLDLPPGYFGNTAAEFMKVVHPEDARTVPQLLEVAMRHGGSCATEYRINPFGSPRWLNSIGRVIQDAKGEPVRMVGGVVDVTARRQAEEALRRSNRELEEFAYVASHDLQEPLRNVALFTQILFRRASGPPSEITAQCQEHILKGVDQMQSMIRDLLAYSRVIHEDAQAGEAICELDRALDQALENVRLRIVESGAVIHREPLPSAVGDELQLSQLFQNLLTNAIKYSRPDSQPVIHVRGRVSGDLCYISIADNGIGFDQKYAERIFGLFKRLERGLHPGTGIGLAICKRILERYGGRIWAESQEGKGATFYFTLPRPLQKSSK